MSTDYNPLLHMLDKLEAAYAHWMDEFSSMRSTDGVVEQHYRDIRRAVEETVEQLRAERDQARAQIDRLRAQLIRMHGEQHDVADAVITAAERLKTKLECLRGP